MFQNYIIHQCQYGLPPDVIYLTNIQKWEIHFDQELFLFYYRPKDFFFLHFRIPKFHEFKARQLLHPFKLKEILPFSIHLDTHKL
jgi:hypothetical protein